MIDKNTPLKIADKKLQEKNFAKETPNLNGKEVIQVDGGDKKTDNLLKKTEILDKNIFEKDVNVKKTEIKDENMPEISDGEDSKKDVSKREVTKKEDSDTKELLEKATKDSKTSEEANQHLKNVEKETGKPAKELAKGLREAAENITGKKPTDINKAVQSVITSGMIDYFTKKYDVKLGDSEKKKLTEIITDVNKQFLDADNKKVTDTKAVFDEILHKVADVLADAIKGKDVGKDDPTYKAIYSVLKFGTSLLFEKTNKSLTERAISFSEGLLGPASWPVKILYKLTAPFTHEWAIEGLPTLSGSMFGNFVMLNFGDFLSFSLKHTTPVRLAFGSVFSGGLGFAFEWLASFLYIRFTEAQASAKEKAA